MKCECAEQVDRLLKPKGEALDLAFNTKGQVFYVVKTNKLSGGRGRCTLMLAKYCPFCGIEQENIS